LHSIKALIVDDEKEYVNALIERLEVRGIDVIGAFSGEEALSILASHPVDVVVLDVLMPGLGGIETLVRIKKSYPQKKIIMLSGHADVDTAIKGMELGAYDYLVKPVAFDELLYRIEDAANSDP
jgi:DNA-binding response OmpR family regulator